MIRCPECGSANVAVSAQPAEDQKEYGCAACGSQYTTVEVPLLQLRRLIAASIELERLRVRAVQ